MAVISHCGVDYTAPTVEVQSDASATSLEATKVPTGQTITSYLNSNLKRIAVSVTTSNSSNVPPYSAYGEVSILSYVQQYGDIIGAFLATNSSSNPGSFEINSNWVAHIWTKSATTTAKLYITCCKFNSAQ